MFARDDRIAALYLFFDKLPRSTFEVLRPSICKFLIGRARWYYNAQAQVFHGASAFEVVQRESIKGRE